jgi:hypothetical protein
MRLLLSRSLTSSAPARVPVTKRGLAITNVVANRLLIPVLKSRAGRRLGRRLAVVKYLRLRLAGKDHGATAYVMRDGDGVCVVAELEPHVSTSSG